MCRFFPNTSSIRQLSPPIFHPSSMLASPISCPKLLASWDMNVYLSNLGQPYGTKGNDWLDQLTWGSGWSMKLSQVSQLP